MLGEAGKLQEPGPSEQQAVNADVKGKHKVEEVRSEEGPGNYRERQSSKQTGSSSMPATKVEVQSPSQASVSVLSFYSSQSRKLSEIHHASLISWGYVSLLHSV